MTLPVIDNFFNKLKKRKRFLVCQKEGKLAFFDRLLKKEKFPVFDYRLSQYSYRHHNYILNLNKTERFTFFDILGKSKIALV